MSRIVVAARTAFIVNGNAWPLPSPWTAEGGGPVKGRFNSVITERDSAMNDGKRKWRADVYVDVDSVLANSVNIVNYN